MNESSARARGAHRRLGKSRSDATWLCLSRSTSRLARRPHVARTFLSGVGPTEFAFLVDLNNDRKALEILPQFTGAANSPLLWYALQDRKWVKHIASPQSCGHGIGVGDLNGNGRNDILRARGWLEAPADPRAPAEWTFHATD